MNTDEQIREFIKAHKAYVFKPDYANDNWRSTRLSLAVGEGKKAGESFYESISDEDIATAKRFLMCAKWKMHRTNSDPWSVSQFEIYAHEPEQEADRLLPSAEQENWPSSQLPRAACAVNLILAARSYSNALSYCKTTKEALESVLIDPSLRITYFEPHHAEMFIKHGKFDSNVILAKGFGDGVSTITELHRLASELKKEEELAASEKLQRPASFEDRLDKGDNGPSLGSKHTDPRTPPSDSWS